MQRIYFDNAATTPVDPLVVQVMAETLACNFGNPSSIHAEGRQSRAIIEEARKKVALAIRASIGEVFFTSCGTESNNMILKGAVRDLGVRQIISSPIEHHCVLHSLESIKKYGEAEISFVQLQEDGHVDLEHLENLLRNSGKKTLVSLMHANNEVGTLLDLEKVGQLCQNYSSLFHSDTVQTIGYYPVDVSKIPIDFLSASAHKFYGPKGTGFVYIHGEHRLSPFIDGGSQERNMRGGTENIAGIAGLARALELAVENMEERRTHISTIRDYFAARLQDAFPSSNFNTPADGRAHYKILSVSFPPSPKNELLLMNLDIAGISASGGSACSSGVDIGSHVLTALKKDPERATIRFSFSHHNTMLEVDAVMKQLNTIFQPTSA